MKKKTLRSVIQDILLGLKKTSIISISGLMLLLSYRTAWSQDFSPASVNTVITLTAIDVNSEVDEETVLSDLVQSGTIYVSEDSAADKSYKLINTEPVMESKIYNQIISTIDNSIKVKISAKQSDDKDPTATTKEPIYLVTSENIAGMLPDNLYSKIGVADVDFTNGSSYNFDIYVSTETLAGYDNSISSGIKSNYVQDVSLSIFPNPAQDFLNVNIAGGISQVTKMNLVNLIGVNVLNVKPEQVQQAMQLNVSTLPHGIYYLSVETANKQNIVKRVTILN